MGPCIIPESSFKTVLLLEFILERNSLSIRIIHQTIRVGINSCDEFRRIFGFKGGKNGYMYQSSQVKTEQKAVFVSF